MADKDIIPLEKWQKLVDELVKTTSGFRDDLEKAEDERDKLKAVNKGLVAALKDAESSLRYLAENHPNVLGWVGHEETGGPWPVVLEVADRALGALAAAKENGDD